MVLLTVVQSEDGTQRWLKNLNPEDALDLLGVLWQRARAVTGGVADSNHSGQSPEPK